MACGNGYFVAIVVGENTCEGKILASVEQRSNELTPLQEKLEVIATDIGKLGMFCAILIFHALMMRTFIEGMIRKDFDLFGGERSEALGDKCSQRAYTPASYTASPNTPVDKLTDPTAWNNAVSGGSAPVYVAETSDETWLRANCTGAINQYITEWIKHIITGIAIIVVAVPEGLPLAVMCSLAYSVMKMLEDKNLVKRLTSCEIMGGANNICSDKTGTLTMNIMTWVKVWSGVSQDIKDETTFASVIPTPKVQELLKQAVCCNTVGTAEDAGATDKAMLKLMARWNVDTKDMRSKLLPKNMRRFPFDSKRKRMSTVVELPAGELSYPKRLHTKGASEIILATCTSYLDADGNKQALNDQVTSQLTN